MVYYVGENNGSHYHSPALAASGVGLEVAQGWEKAIRQALMPVTPQPSVANAAAQGRDHSKENLLNLFYLYVDLCVSALSRVFSFSNLQDFVCAILLRLSLCQITSVTHIMCVETMRFDKVKSIHI